MERKGVVSAKIKNVGSTISEIGGSYDTPVAAFKEYVSNSIDARIPGEQEDIVIIVNKKNPSLLQIDNGKGMSLGELIDIPQSIGDSKKRFISGKIGRRQFGFLAFLSFAERARIISRKQEDQEGLYNFLILDKEKLIRESPISEWAVLSEKELREIGLPKFPHGTAVLIDSIHPALIERHFSPASLSKLLSQLYSPLLREGEVVIKVGNLGRSPITVEAPEYSRHKILEDELEVEYLARNKAGDKEKRKGNIRILLYIDPEISGGRVGHYQHGLRIMPSLTNLAELDHPPWNSGKLQGEVDEDFLPLNLPNTAPLAGSRLELFCEQLRKYEPELNDKLKQLVSRKEKTREEKFAEYLLRYLDQAYKGFFERFTTLTKGREGDEQKRVRVIPGAVVTVVGGHQAPGRETGRQELEEDSEGELESVKRARRIISGTYSIAYEPFDIQENHKMSRFDEHLNLVVINTSHGEYQRLSTRDKERDRYVLGLVAGRVAQGEYKKNRSRNLIQEAEGVEWMIGLREHLYQSALRGLKLD